MTITKIIGILATIYLSVLFIVFLTQRKLLYYPDTNSYLEEKNLKHKIEKIFTRTEDGLNLRAWFHKKNNVEKTLLFFHGNAGNLENRIYKLNHLGDLNINYLILAYRGFNGNSGNPTEKNIYLDAKSALTWLNSKGIADKNIILYGESLGAAVAIEIAKDKNFSGIILESPFTSMIEMGKVYYPYLPVRLLLKDKFDNQSKIKSINSPILVMHGRKDKIVPFYMGKKIYDLANKPKYSYFIDFDEHMMSFDLNLIKAIETFIKSLK
jgi:hypothetical protein